MGSITRNQHYVSQCVIREFANEKERIFEALLESSKIIPTSCRNSMSESYTYEHPRLETNTLENYFGKYETEMGIAINELKKKIDLYEDEKINIDEIRDLATEQMKNFILFYYKSGALLHEYQFQLEKKEDRIPYLLRKISDSKYLSNLSKTISTFYKFAIIKSSEREFLLSDQYLCTASLSIKGRFTNISNRHIGLKDIVILIPISSEYYLMYYDGKLPFELMNNDVNILTKQQTDLVNKTIINNSYKKTVALNKEPLERALKQFEYQSPITMIAGFSNGRKMGATLKKEVFFTDDIKELWRILCNNDWATHYKEINRNELCYCNSGKKLKKCCIDTVIQLRNITQTYLGLNDGQGHYHLIQVHPNSIVEKAVVEF